MSTCTNFHILWSKNTKNTDIIKTTAMQMYELAVVTKFSLKSNIKCFIQCFSPVYQTSTIWCQTSVLNDARAWLAANKSYLHKDFWMEFYKILSSVYARTSKKENLHPILARFKLPLLSLWTKSVVNVHAAKYAWCTPLNFSKRKN